MSEQDLDKTGQHSKTHRDSGLALLERPKTPNESLGKEADSSRATEIFQFADEVSHALTVDDAVQAGAELMQALTASPRPGVDSAEFSTELVRNRINEIRAERLRGDLSRLEEQIALASEPEIKAAALMWQYAKLRKLRRDTVIAEPAEQRRLAKRFEFLEERLFHKGLGVSAD